MQEEQNQIVEQVVQPANTVPAQAQTPKQVKQVTTGNQTTQTKVIPKDPGIATVLSFFWTGLGQIYNGQIAKGLLFMLIQAINVALMLVLIGFITFPLFWIYGMWDANKTAKATHGL
jgi:TM2 domain-containing membrane protein YozV